MFKDPSHSGTGRVRINFSNLSELMSVRGVGKRTASAILELRDRFGNITPDLFLSARIKGAQQMVGQFDFSPYPLSDDADNCDFENKSCRGAGLAYGLTNEPQDQFRPRDMGQERLDLDTFVRMYGKSEPTYRRFGSEYNCMDPREEESLRLPPMRPEAGEWPTNNNRGYSNYRDEREYERQGRGGYCDPRNQEWPTNNNRGYSYYREDRECDRVARGGYGGPRYQEEPRRPRENRRSTPSMPKSIVFDGTAGKESWQAFKTKLLTFLESQNWSDRERKDNLCYCLVGSASEFFSNIVKREPEVSFDEIMQRLERRFDLKDLPETSLVAFMYASQGAKETVIEWAHRIIRLATLAYPELHDAHIYSQAVLQFCKGLADKDAGHYALTARPRNMDEAIDKVRWYQHADNIMYGKGKQSVRQVEVEDDSTFSEDSFKAWRVNSHIPAKQKNSGYRENTNERAEKRVHFKPQPKPDDTTAERLTSLESDVRSLGSSMQGIKEQISNLVKGMESLQASLKPMRGRSRSISPVRSYSCFNCGDKNHFIRDCPLVKEKKKVNIINEEEDLNSEGSED